MGKDNGMHNFHAAFPGKLLCSGNSTLPRVARRPQKTTYNGVGRIGDWNEWTIGKDTECRTEKFGLNLQVIKMICK